MRKNLHLGYSKKILFFLGCFFLINIIIAYSIHFSIIAQTCMTVAQVQSDSRCLYMLNGKIYEMGTRFVPHISHPCGTDVTSIIPSFHLQNPANYLLPNYIADICTTTISPVPTLTLSPSPTTNPNNLTFSLTVFLHSIGLGGDNVNPNSKGNANPVRTQRNATITLLDANNNIVATQQGLINYTGFTGNFTGTVSMATVPNGFYSVIISVNSFLNKRAPGFIQVPQSTPYNIAPVSLTAGDINNDGKIDISDYNILIGCFGSKQHSSSCINSVLPDLNDDGTVDGVDYNIFIRELSAQKGS